MLGERRENGNESSPRILTSGEKVNAPVALFKCAASFRACWRHEKRRQWAFNRDPSFSKPTLTSLPPSPFLLYPFFRRDSVCNCSPLSKLIVTGGEAAVQRRGSTPRNFVRSVHPPRAPSSSAFPGYHLHNFAAASTCTIAYIGSCPSGGPKLVHPGRRAWMSRGFGAAENWFEIYRESRACG